VVVSHEELHRFAGHLRRQAPTTIKAQSKVVVSEFLNAVLFSETINFLFFFVFQASTYGSYGSPVFCESVSDNDCDMIPEHIIPLPNQQDNIEADLATIEWEDTDDVTALSAEGVALSLLSKFNDKQLPCASEIMMWMVSEKDAPQQILPMPDYLIANPDEYNGTNTIIRGTKEWAPPRQQIIFTRHPPAE
jgi:hypothetical protein